LQGLKKLYWPELDIDLAAHIVSDEEYGMAGSMNEFLSAAWTKDHNGNVAGEHD